MRQLLMVFSFTSLNPLYISRSREAQLLNMRHVRVIYSELRCYVSMVKPSCGSATVLFCGEAAVFTTRPLDADVELPSRETDRGQ